MGSDGREHLSVPLIAEAERVRIEEQSKKMVSAVRADYDEIMRRYGDELEAWARQELPPYHQGSPQERRRASPLQELPALRGPAGIEPPPSMWPQP